MKKIFALSILIYFFLITSCKEKGSFFTIDKNDSDSTFINANNNSLLAEINDENGSDRVVWQKPAFILNKIGDLSNKVIADIGAGTGFFSFRLIPKSKKVIAVDIDPIMISFLDSMSQNLPERYKNVLETRLAEPQNPGLHAGEVDYILIVNTYTYLQNRIEYLRNLKSCMTMNGEIMIIDYKNEGINITNSSENKLPYLTIENELKTAGYKDINIDNKSLDFQYIITAKNN